MKERRKTKGKKLKGKKRKENNRRSAVGLNIIS